MQDVEAIASVHVACWAECYPFLPLGLHEKRGILERAEQWRRRIVDPGLSCTYVLEDAGRIVGFSHVMDNRDTDIAAQAELHACYFLPEYRRLPAGPQMMLRLLDHVDTIGWTSFCLWAWLQNPVRRTYGALGLHPEVRRDRVIEGYSAPEIGYVCNDIPAVRRRLERNVIQLERRGGASRNQRYCSDRLRPIALRNGIDR
ncbi:GNAT family N-acetyltransferase [Thalassovita aquimarina]|uniref:GNAT family N-acetyltransferase n=1 Tax=Thalassovita aquimarina TaxID=2785917 RepID=A0ABS5HSY8_9RHOB|nr:GNAT family N-acetyltransferase [Thalassovita aquimarina]MBR9651892.1 GNAT family N-acetyltransferase [Thalassovita aquimarina]